MANSIESDIFEWEEWDPIDTATFQFHDVKLRRDLGDLKAGSKFDLATINYERSTLEFHDFPDDDEPILRGEFSISLVAKPSGATGTP